MANITVEQFAKAVAHGQVQYTDWRGKDVSLEPTRNWQPSGWSALHFESELWESDDLEGLIQIDEEAHTIKAVDSHGGEGQGSLIYVVFLVGEDQYFKKIGNYQSHYGTDWDGPILKVEPIEKTIVTWKVTDG